MFNRMYMKSKIMRDIDKGQFRLCTLRIYFLQAYFYDTNLLCQNIFHLAFLIK